VACLERRQESMARKWGVAVAVAVFVAAMGLAVVHAGPPAGAIFTTVADGSEVNYNIYLDKEDVYLDGGPGPGAPQGAAGLDDGTYVFQVTDPSGKTLLSTDPAGCRLFEVDNGIITGLVIDASCTAPHKTGSDVDHGATTVQLMPYDDTPNPGGEYKVWVTPLSNYACNTQLGKVDCTGGRIKGVAHGFVPKYSKTDNFKVRGTPKEIDTRFHDGSLGGWYLDGRGITWTDPLGASNIKWSYLNRALDINHEAHVEAVEYGTHYITIADQPNCTIGAVAVDYKLLPKEGPQTVAVTIRSTWQGDTIFVDVACK
jgi:hypothetical protein